MHLESIRARALLALALTVGFYALAVGLMVVLIALPVLEVMYAGRIHPRIAFFSLVGAGAIGYSILPRLDRFERPGPVLNRESQPDLLEAIQGVADRAGQSMPREIYLIPDANAWVTERGGLLGIGSTRVMGIGFPLLSVLTRAQLLAVVAHEFGHYANADTRLVGWVYRTRSAIVRSVQNVNGILQVPFVAYARLFLRITSKISRSQEFGADAFAASIVGPRAVIDGLERIETAAPAFEMFWAIDVAPVLSCRRLPPIAEGLTRYVQSEDVKGRLQSMLDDARRNPSVDPYDSHPPIPERISALRELPENGSAEDEPAFALIPDIRPLEDLLFEHLFHAAGEEAPQPIAWEDVGSEVLHPTWRKNLDENLDLLSEIRFEDIPRIVSDPGDYASRFMRLDPSTSAKAGAVQSLADEIHRTEALPAALDCPSCGRELELTPESAGALQFGCRYCGDAFDFRVWIASQRQALGTLIGSALSLDLLKRDWLLLYEPGRPPTLQKGEHEIQPFQLVRRLFDGGADEEEWRQMCEIAGWSGPLAVV